MKYSIRTLPQKLFTDGEDILFFFGHRPNKNGLTKACFSQWWPADFRDEDGHVFHFAEQWMMYQKAMLFGDNAVAQKILVADEPREMKALGREVKNFNPTVWDAHKGGIVVEGNVLKFSQNPELREFLLATGNMVLVEASPYDKIWGIGLRSHECDVSQWRGKNLLGFALMEARDRIREEIEK